MNNISSKYRGIEKLISSASVEEIHEEIKLQTPVNLNDIEAQGLYIFGVGKLGQRIYDYLSQKQIKIHGFVDNSAAKQGSLFNGLNVISANQIPAGSIIYIASATYYNAIFNQLSGLGFTKVFSHNQAFILFYGDEGFPVEMYQKELTRDLVENKKNYLAVFDLLEDAASKQVFDSLLQYRLTLNHDLINAVHTSLSKEYFDNEVISLSDQEVFFDLGGFNGDSAENFINHVDEKYKSVHIFEPDQALVDQAKERLKKYPDITYNALGIFDKKTTLYFDVTGGLDGIISTEGTLKIDTTTIDLYKTAEPTYIKFDVEGVEIEAINGAKETIEKQHPKLAIASYHYPKHLWEIPLLIKHINPRYKIKLRHYTDSVFDSIFYFI